MGSVGRADAALKPHAGKSDGNAAIEVMRKFVMWWLLARQWGYSATKSWVCVGLEFLFLGALDGPRCAKSLRRSRCGCSGGPTSRNGQFSALKQLTTPHKFACHALVTWDMPRPGGQSLQFDSIDSIRLFSKRRILGLSCHLCCIAHKTRKKKMNIFR